MIIQTEGTSEYSFAVFTGTILLGNATSTFIGIAFRGNASPPFALRLSTVRSQLWSTNEFICSSIGGIWLAKRRRGRLHFGNKRTYLGGTLVQARKTDS